MPLCPLDFIRPFGPNPNLPNTSNPVFQLPSSIPVAHSNELSSFWYSLSNAAIKFWEKWNYEYLLSLRERHKKISPKNSRQPIPGELVIVHSPIHTRSLWRTAIILQVHVNSNRIPDTATIRFPSGKITTRSVHHLYPLETDFPKEKTDLVANLADDSQNNPTDPVSADDSQTNPTPIPFVDNTKNGQRVLQLRSRQILRQ